MQDNLHKLVAYISQNVPKIEFNYTCTNIHSHTHYNLFQYSNTWSSNFHKHIQYKSNIHHSLNYEHCYNSTQLIISTFLNTHGFTNMINTLLIQNHIALLKSNMFHFTYNSITISIYYVSWTHHIKHVSLMSFKINC